MAAAAGVKGDGSAFFLLGVLGVDGGSGGLVTGVTSGSRVATSLSFFTSSFFEPLEMAGDVLDLVVDWGTGKVGA